MKISLNYFFSTLLLAFSVSCVIAITALPNAWAAEKQVKNHLDQPLKAGAKVAFFGVSFVDQSTEGAYNGVRDDENVRMDVLEDAIAARFKEEGFVIMDNAPIQSRLDQVKNPATCYGCEIRMGEKLGADYVLVGEVRKTSNLILNMVLLLSDVKTEKLVRAKIVSLRGNNNKSWLRAMNYIFKTHFFPEK